MSLKQAQTTPPTIGGNGKVGILSLDTVFPRILGDAGNPDSYPCAAEVMVVDGADSPAIVRDGAPDEDLLRRFEEAARRLEHRGATAIVSTCGFLISAQQRIASCVRIPVLLSALSLYPLVRATCPPQNSSGHKGRIGILTASRAALGTQALSAAGITDPDDVVIAGLEHAPAFAQTFLVTRTAQATTLDRAEIEACVIDAAQTLHRDVPDLSALLLECGNLPPYADALRQTTGLPVFHLVDAALSLAQAHAAPTASNRP